MGTRIALPDGSTAVLREVRPEDKPLFREGFSELSAHSRYLRFFEARKTLTEEDLRYLTEVDGHDHHAIVAIATGPDGRVHGAGSARFIRDPRHGDRAEMAVVVVDRYQGHGIGRALLRLLIRAARAREVKTLEARLLAENHRLLAALQRIAPSGTVRTDPAESVLTYEFGTD